MSDQSGVAGGIDDTCGPTRRALRGTSVRRGGLVKWGYWAGAWPTHERLKLLMELGRRALPERIWVKNSSAVAPLYLSESVSGQWAGATRVSSRASRPRSKRTTLLRLQRPVSMHSAAGSFGTIQCLSHAPADTHLA